MSISTTIRQKGVISTTIQQKGLISTTIITDYPVQQNLILDSGFDDAGAWGITDNDPEFGGVSTSNAEITGSKLVYNGGTGTAWVKSDVLNITSGESYTLTLTCDVDWNGGNIELYLGGSYVDEIAPVVGENTIVLTAAGGEKVLELAFAFSADSCSFTDISLV